MPSRVRKRVDVAIVLLCLVFALIFVLAYHRLGLGAILAVIAGGMLGGVVLLGLSATQ
jgi:Kef-type K+ transport system membrane component KefB